MKEKTKEGLEVLIIHNNKNNKKGIVKVNEGHWVSQVWDKNGKSTTNGVFDLMGK